MTASEMLSLYTEDDSPTAEAQALAGSGGTVIRIDRSYIKDEEMWLTDTPGGAVVLAMLVALGLGLVALPVVALLDVFWWSRRPESVQLGFPHHHHHHPYLIILLF